MTQIYLVPGFMGFQSLGQLAYFRRVPEMLKQHLDGLGHPDVEVFECPTLPSGSIARRAQRALQFIADHGGERASSIHVVGHSTGGLDARLLAAPGVRLVPGGLEEEIGKRIHSVVSVSTPHFGTPMANKLVDLPFRRTLEAIGLLGLQPRGRTALLAVARALEWVARADDWMGRTDTFLDTLVNKVLKQIGRDEDDPVWGFLRELSRDQGAALQLTMESMHLFNAAVADRPGTQYSSVVSVAPPPRAFPFEASDFLSPVRALSVFAFWALYRMASQVPDQYPCTALDVNTLNLNEHSAPLEITRTSNDGVVPCQSQAYGKVLDIVLGDHLDVVGQFPGSGGDSHADWLPCGAGFGEQAFFRLWSLVAQEIAANIPAKRKSSRPSPTKAPPSSKNGKPKSKVFSTAN